MAKKSKSQVLESGIKNITQDAAPLAPLGNLHAENRRSKKRKARAKVCNVFNLINLTMTGCDLPLIMKYDRPQRLLPPPALLTSLFPA